MKYLLLLLIPLSLLAGCSGGNVDLQLAPDSQEVAVAFTENGVEVKSMHVYVENYRPGKNTTVTFLVTNNCGRAIKPTIQKVFGANPEDDTKLAGRGYKSVPSYFSDWIQIPAIMDIADGRSARYSLTLAIPENAGVDIPKLWTFDILLYSGTGGFQQVASVVTIAVGMR